MYIYFYYILIISEKRDVFVISGIVIDSQKFSRILMHENFLRSIYSVTFYEKCDTINRQIKRKEFHVPTSTM